MIVLLFIGIFIVGVLLGMFIMGASTSGKIYDLENELNSLKNKE